jgi:macrolide transport system ATP-binding/permease protein
MSDEPTGALDSQTGQLVMQMLRGLCTRFGKTVIVVTHDPGIEQYADRMVMLRDGSVIKDYMTAGSMAEAVLQPQMQT